MNNNLKIAFIILHYQNIDVSEKCLEYLSELKYYKDCEIVLVDNASPNGSGKVLNEKYKDIKNIHVLCLEKNLGFASGNNYGYLYAKKELNVDMAIIMNSDVFIKDIDFINKIYTLSNKYKNYSIIAPDIINKNDYHQNPYMLKRIENSSQYKIILKKIIGYILYSIPIINKKLISRKKINLIKTNSKETNCIENFIPHGACLIYTAKWLKDENKAFVEGTFLFVEEELLYDYADKMNHKIIYLPELEVYHIEDASQDSVNSNLIKKKKNQIKNEIFSRKVLLKERKKKEVLK